jgi:hypothetical protein
MDYTDYYYSNYCGVVDNEKDIDVTRATIEYLVDNGKKDTEILAILEQCAGKTRIGHEDLPDSVWDGLIERGKFYYHHSLQLIPEARFDSKTCTEIKTPFYLEIKCSFSYDDLIQYFMKQLGIDPELFDRQRYIGQFEFLLKTSRFSFVEPLDFILAMIDNAKRKDGFMVFEPFDLKNNGNVSEVFQQLKTVAAQSNAMGTNKEIIRCE